MSGQRILVVGLVVVVGLALLGFFLRGPLKRIAIRLFGPPQVEMTESFETLEEGLRFDHSAWDAILHQFVTEGGSVDYEGLNADPAQLDGYLQRLAEVDLDQLGRDERLALLINAYNAFTVRLILDFDADGSLESIRDIPDGERWEDPRWLLGGNLLSLSQIEHEQIRPNFKEPRIHFALVCAAYSCPPLRPEAYIGKTLEDQLQDQTVRCHQGDRWFRFDADAGVAHRTELYDWYRGDFEQAEDSILAYMAGYSPALQEALDSGRTIRQQKIDYSWKLNRVGSF